MRWWCVERSGRAVAARACLTTTHTTYTHTGHFNTRIHLLTRFLPQARLDELHSRLAQMESGTCGSARACKALVQEAREAAQAARDAVPAATASLREEATALRHANEAFAGELRRTQEQYRLSVAEHAAMLESMREMRAELAARLSAAPRPESQTPWRERGRGGGGGGGATPRARQTWDGAARGGVDSDTPRPPLCTPTSAASPRNRAVRAPMRPNTVTGARAERWRRRVRSQPLGSVSLLFPPCVTGNVTPSPAQPPSLVVVPPSPTAQGAASPAAWARLEQALGTAGRGRGGDGPRSEAGTEAGDEDGQSRPLSAMTWGDAMAALKTGYRSPRLATQ